MKHSMRIIMSVGLLTIATSFIGCSKSQGVRIKSTDFVDGIAANGNEWHFEGNDIVRLVMNVGFKNDLAPEVAANSEEHRRKLYETIIEGCSFYVNNKKIKSFYGYWPKQSGKTYAKNMTLFYVVPKKRIFNSMLFSYDGKTIGLPDYDFTYTVPDVKTKREVTEYVFNGYKIPIVVSKETNTLMLANLSSVFKDNRGREVFILGFKEPAEPAVVYANIKLIEGQSSTFTLDKCRDGLVGKNLGDIPKGKRSSKGDLHLSQNGDKITFTVAKGFVELGIEFEIRYGLSGDLEGNMILNYFTTGTKIITKTKINTK